jgi:3',5'-nucleoside bisphosphate phosphatase
MSISAGPLRSSPNGAPRHGIDLHAHTNASDGTDTPEQLMAAALSAGLSAIAITDHDTTGGWARAARARPEGLTLVRGTEFSTSVRVGQRKVSVHLLGYLFDPEHPTIVAEHQRLRGERLHRGMAIVERMVAAGVPITAAQVMEIAGDAPVGRPHIGRALVQAGVVASVDDAFASYLAGRGPYYVPKADTELRRAIQMISAAGGVSVVAHPRARGEYRALTAEMFTELAGSGLGGLEVDHPDHPAEARAELRALADGLGLIVTGSSDYHGANKVLSLGQERTDPEQLDRIVAATSGATAPLGPEASRP